MERVAKSSLLVRVGAALSSLVLLGVSGLAYLLVADVYDTYPQLAYRAVFTVIGVLIPLPLAFFFGFVALRIRTLSLQQLMTCAARCMWSFFGLFLLTWLLEGLLIGEAPGPFMYVCVGTLILSATIARLLMRSSPVEWCNHFLSFGVGYALSWSGVSSCWVGWGVSRDLVRMSRLR